MHVAGQNLLTGAAISALGVLAFFACRLDSERLPTSIFFAIAINAAANFSQVVGGGETPLLGSGLPVLIHWGTYTLCVSYLIRNQLAEKRVLIFFGLVVVVGLVA